MDPPGAILFAGRSDRTHRLRPEWLALLPPAGNAMRPHRAPKRECRSRASGHRSQLRQCIITLYVVEGQEGHRCLPESPRPSTSALTATTQGRNGLHDQPVHVTDASAQRPSRRTGAPVRIGQGGELQLRAQLRARRPGRHPAGSECPAPLCECRVLGYGVVSDLDGTAFPKQRG